MGLLDKQTSVVVIKTRPEFNYMIAWCDDRNKSVSSSVLNLDLPVCLRVAGDIVGWTHRMDRALDYISFNRFLSEEQRVDDSPVYQETKDDINDAINTAVNICNMSDNEHIVEMARHIADKLAPLVALP